MWRIILLGLVQGLSEFLPISSSGHLIVLRGFFGMVGRQGQWEVALHGGTLLAIVAGYRHDLRDLIKGAVKGQSTSRKTIALIIVATIPALIVGYWLKSWITQWFIPLAAGAGWLATTAALWLTPDSEYGTKKIKDMSWGQAVFIGLAQTLALWPGLSRSGSTIFAGRVLGLSPREAARFSFYMALPVIVGAMVLTFSSVSYWDTSIAVVAIGVGTAVISGIFAIKWVKHALSATRLWRQFGWYTLILGIVTLWLGSGHGL